MTYTLDPELLAAFSRWVEARLGLAFPSERLRDLECGLRDGAAELGFENAGQCACACIEGRLNHEQFSRLAGHLTVNGTYFLREPAMFEALRLRVIPALVRERRGRTQHLRIWSAGCCTGEEAYSIAIALRSAIFDIDEWRITLLATDINPLSLHKAEAGVYDGYAVHRVPKKTREMWFHQISQRQFEIKPEIRDMVTFGCLNLVDDTYPSIETNTGDMDLIFCRNVLMWFSDEQARRVQLNLWRSLLNGGGLVTDVNLVAPFVGFIPAKIPHIALYRKIWSLPSGDGPRQKKKRFYWNCVRVVILIIALYFIFRRHFL